MSQNNTARQFGLIASQEAAPQAKPLPVDKWPAGFGLVAAVLASLTLWLGLLWLGALAVRIVSA